MKKHSFKRSSWK